MLRLVDLVWDFFSERDQAIRYGTFQHRITTIPCSVCDMVFSIWCFQLTFYITHAKFCRSLGPVALCRGCFTQSIGIAWVFIAIASMFHLVTVPSTRMSVQYFHSSYQGSRQRR
jgi:hypothetical protein